MSLLCDDLGGVGGKGAKPASVLVVEARNKTSVTRGFPLKSVGSGVSTAAKTASGDSGQAVRHHSVSLFASWSTSIWLNQLSVSSEVVHTSSFGPWIRCKGMRDGSTKARKRSCVFCGMDTVVVEVVVVVV